nr:MAG TPA: hypothetical protein [Caudoviricetes sp.]
MKSFFQAYKKLIFIGLYPTECRYYHFEPKNRLFFYTYKQGITYLYSGLHLTFRSGKIISSENQNNI